MQANFLALQALGRTTSLPPACSCLTGKKELNRNHPPASAMRSAVFGAKNFLDPVSASLAMPATAMSSSQPQQRRPANCQTGSGNSLPVQNQGLGWSSTLRAACEQVTPHGPLAESEKWPGQRPCTSRGNAHGSSTVSEGPLQNRQMVGHRHVQQCPAPGGGMNLAAGRRGFLQQQNGITIIPLRLAYLGKQALVENRLNEISGGLALCRHRWQKQRVAGRQMLQPRFDALVAEQAVNTRCASARIGNQTGQGVINARGFLRLRRRRGEAQPGRSALSAPPSACARWQILRRQSYRSRLHSAPMRRSGHGHPSSPQRCRGV